MTWTTTFTATYTPIQPVVQVANGPVPPQNQTIQAGATNVPVLQFRATNNSGETVVLTGLTLTAQGSGTDNSGIIAVKIWKDLNGNGVVDGGDVLLATVNMPYTVDNGTVVVSFTDSLAPSGSQNYLVTYDFSSAAPSGGYQAVIGASGLIGQGQTSGKNIQLTGAPLNGAVLTISTGTVTATATNSPTPVTSTVVSQPYPNPVMGSGLVAFDVFVPQSTTVQWAVFTTTFRMILDSSQAVSEGKTSITWDLKDKVGRPVSNGLYYIRVQVGNHKGSAVKILKILVIH